jgi:hypothetical protein
MTRGEVLTHLGRFAITPDGAMRISEVADAILDAVAPLETKLATISAAMDAWRMGVADRHETLHTIGVVLLDGDDPDSEGPPPRGDG